MTALRERLEAGLKAGYPVAVVHGRVGLPAAPTPPTSPFPGLDGQVLLVALDMAGVACSVGAACCQRLKRAFADPPGHATPQRPGDQFREAQPRRDHDRGRDRRGRAADCWGMPRVEGGKQCLGIGDWGLENPPDYVGGAIVARPAKHVPQRPATLLTCLLSAGQICYNAGFTKWQVSRHLPPGAMAGFWQDRSIWRMPS